MDEVTLLALHSILNSKPTSMALSPPYLSINPAVLRDASGGDDATVLDLLHIFLRITPPMMGDIELASRMGEPAKVSAKCHDLKGTGQLVGAEQLALLAGHIEGRMNQGESDRLSELVLGLREEFERVASEIAACAATMEAPVGPRRGEGA